MQEGYMQTIARRSYHLVALTLIVVACFSMLVGCSKKAKNVNKNETQDGVKAPEEFDQVKLTDVIFTMGDQEYTLQDMMYTIYLGENDASMYALYYEAEGKDFWETKDDLTGKTNRELVKSSILENAELFAIHYNKAIKEGMTLSEDELSIVEEEAKNIFDVMTEDYVKQTGFTMENLTKQITEVTLANKYYESELEKIEVDEELIREDTPYEEYAQWKVEYIFFPTTYYDEDFNQYVYEPEDITKIVKQAKETLKEVKAGASMEEVALPLEDVDSGKLSLSKDSEATEESLYEALNSMKVGQLYDSLVEVEDGYYIIRLIDDACTEEYEAVIQQEIDSQRNDIYMQTFEELKKQENISEKKEVWDKVEIGNLAYEAYEENIEPEDTLEDSVEDDALNGDLIGDEGTVG